MIEGVLGKVNFRRKRMLGIAGLMSVAATVALGQLSGRAKPRCAASDRKLGRKVPEFEVASIKPDKSGNGGVRIMFTPDGFSATNVPLKLLASFAYGIKEDLISGEPSWTDSARYDIEAKVAGPDIASCGQAQREAAWIHASATSGGPLQVEIAQRDQITFYL